MDQITDELLQKTIGEMSGMEFIQLFKVANDVKADDSPLFTAEEHNYVKSCTQNRKNSSICIVIWKQIINFAPSIHYERRN